MSIYLIDFENVTSEGLSGVAKLQEEDNVVLFYSANAHKISLSVHRAICNTKAKVTYFEVAVGGKNALDHQLSTYLGYLIGQNQNMKYFIVSKDKGYEYLSDFWKNISIVQNNIEIKRIDSIKIVAPTIESAIDNVDHAVTESIAKDIVEKENTQEVIKETESIESITKGVETKKVETKEVIAQVGSDSYDLKVDMNEDKSNKIYPSKNQSKVVDIKRGNQPVKSDNKKKKYQKEEYTNIKTKNNNKINNKINAKESNNTVHKPSIKVKKDSLNTCDIFARDIRSIIGNELEEQSLKRIIECFEASSTKQELHVKIIGVLGRQMGSKTYNKIKGLMTKVEKNVTAEKDIRSIIDTELREEEFKEVVECFRQSNSKQELHLKVIGALGRERGPEIYNKIKKLMSKIS